VLYESGSGDLFYADCRPGFRARYIQKIAPWALTEYDEEGEAVIHGYREGTDCEVLFELQNLTEVGPAGFGAQELHIGLCGLAYRARVRRGKGKTRWMPLEKAAPARAAHENDWSLSGRVIAFKPLRNPLSGGELFWIHLDLEQPARPARRLLSRRRHGRRGSLATRSRARRTCPAFALRRRRSCLLAREFLVRVETKKLSHRFTRTHTDLICEIRVNLWLIL
jgi:hypothetical protein